MEKTYEYKSQNGSDLSIKIGKVAEQTNGECLIRTGDTILLVTAVSSDKPRAVSYTHLTLPTTPYV